MYNPHPSIHLNQAFSEKPFQGVPPETAMFLFLGLDANYSEVIEQSPIFCELLKYHENGVTFWKEYGVHHPFLLEGYRGDGRFYHRNSNSGVSH